MDGRIFASKFNHSCKTIYLNLIQSLAPKAFSNFQIFKFPYFQIETISTVLSE